MLTLDFAPLADEARTWRLLLRTSATDCYKSLPFQVQRKRVPIEGFVSDKVPRQWNIPRKPSPCKPDPSQTHGPQQTACANSRSEEATKGEAG